MNIKNYSYLKPNITFFKSNQVIYFLVNNNMFEYNYESFKDYLEIPSKLLFLEFTMNEVYCLLNEIKQDNFNYFAYRVNNIKNNSLAYHVIITEKIKVKSIK